MFLKTLLGFIRPLGCLGKPVHPTVLWFGRFCRVCMAPDVKDGEVLSSRMCWWWPHKNPAQERSLHPAGGSSQGHVGVPQLCVQGGISVKDPSVSQPLTTMWLGQSWKTLHCWNLCQVSMLSKLPLGLFPLLFPHKSNLVGDVKP